MQPQNKGKIRLKDLKKDAKKDAAVEKINLRAELDKLEAMIADLKVQYEQYFAGVVNLAPERAHQDLKRMLRTLLKAPFKSSAINYRLRALHSRYSTLDTYWQRVLRQKEDGTYSKDIFKANLRERQALDEARSQTSVGQAQKGLRNLFDTYRSALEKQTGKKQDLDFTAFQSALIQRAKDLKAQHGPKKLSFKVVVRDGKVTIQAKEKDNSTAQ